MCLAVKALVLLVVVFGLSSCNTAIGIYRDTKAGFLWTKERIQGMSSGGGGGGSEAVPEEYGAPIY
jgi:predicted small secreted protein